MKGVVSTETGQNAAILNFAAAQGLDREVIRASIEAAPEVGTIIGTTLSPFQVMRPDGTPAPTDVGRFVRVTSDADSERLLAAGYHKMPAGWHMRGCPGGWILWAPTPLCERLDAQRRAYDARRRNGRMVDDDRDIRAGDHTGHLRVTSERSRADITDPTRR